MKNLIGVVLLILLLFLPVAITAETNTGDAVWESTYETWDFAISLSGGLSYGFKPAAMPALDLIVASYRIEDFVPLDLGVSLRSLITKFENKDTVDPSGWIHIGIGALGIIHLSFDNLQAHTLPFLENFDFYAGFGPVYDIISHSGPYEISPPPIPSNSIGFTTAAGIRYFLLPWLAAHFEIFNWSFSPGLSTGLTFNF
ncbi:MAG: hypothetical protein HN368_03085 [Spirochaetales bacterium]|nr:hypothetical protein [Spirochaetales bacterium]